MAFPELVERKAATLVEARNSVIAAWLWQQYCAPTRCTNPIQISHLVAHSSHGSIMLC